MSRRMILSSFAAGLMLVSTALSAQTGPTLSGYVKTDFSTDLEGSSETDVSNARVKVAGTLNDRTSYTVFVDGVRDDVMLDVFVKHTIIPSVAVQVGQFKTAYSTDNLTASSKIAFINRPYMKGDASPAFRDKGVQVTYSNKLFDAVAGVMNGSGQNKSETNNNKSIAGRVVAKVLPQMKISANYYTGKNAADSIEDEFVNIGANGTVGALEYSGEFAQKNHGSRTSSAWFAWVAYDIQTGMDYVKTLTPAIRIETSDPDTDIKDDARSRYTFGVTAHFAKKYTDRVMINYELREVETGDVNDMFGVEYVVMF